MTSTVINTQGALLSFYSNVTTGTDGKKQVQQTDGIEEIASTGAHTVLKAGPYQIDLLKGHVLLREYSDTGSLQDGKGRRYDSLDLRDGTKWKTDGQSVPALVGQEQPYTMELPTEFGKPPVRLTVESTKNAQTGRWEATNVTVVNGDEAVRVEGVNTADNVHIAKKTYTQGQAYDQATPDGKTFQVGEHLQGFFVHDQYGTRFTATKANVDQANANMPVTATTIQNGVVNVPAAASPAPKVSTNVVDGKKVITIDDENYTIVAKESNQSVKITDKKTGKSVEAWGDPHLVSNGKKVGDFKSDMMIQLPKGGSVIIKTLPASGDPNAKATYSSEVTFVKGSHAVSIEGIGKNDGKLRVGEITNVGGEEVFRNALRNKTDIHLRMGNDGQLYSTLHEAQNKDSRLTAKMLTELDQAALKRQAAAEKAAASAPATPAAPAPLPALPTNASSLQTYFAAQAAARAEQMSKLSALTKSATSSNGTVGGVPFSTYSVPISGAPGTEQAGQQNGREFMGILQWFFLRTFNVHLGPAANDNAQAMPAYAKSA